MGAYLRGGSAALHAAEQSVRPAVVCEGGGSTHGELHILLAMLPGEGFMSAKYILVLILKRGAEE